MKTFIEKKLEPTPKWIIEAKNNPVLDIVLDNHDWEQKYGLLEKIIEGQKNQALQEQRDMIMGCLPEIEDDGCVICDAQSSFMKQFLDNIKSKKL